jgi:hypothetical protein
MWKGLALMEIHGCDIFFENVTCEITEDLVVPVIKKYWPDVVYEKQIEDGVVHLFIHPNHEAEKAWDDEGWSEENDTTLIYVIWNAVKHQLTFVIDDNKTNKFIVDDIKNTIGF